MSPFLSPVMLSLVTVSEAGVEDKGNSSMAQSRMTVFRTDSFGLTLKLWKKAISGWKPVEEQRYALNLKYTENERKHEDQQGGINSSNHPHWRCRSGIHLDNDEWLLRNCQKYNYYEGLEGIGCGSVLNHKVITDSQESVMASSGARN